MASTPKTVIFLGNFANAGSGAQTFTVPGDGFNNSKLGPANEYCAMDVIFNVKTLSGTSPTTQPSIQERFSDLGFIETGNYGATFTTAGKYIVAHDGQTGQTGTANIKYGYAMLGKGTDKQIVFTNGGTIGTISVDVYVVLYTT
jgi:hypothetical protein